MEQSFDGNRVTAANLRECQQWTEVAPTVNRAPVLSPADITPAYRERLQELGVANVHNLGRVRIDFVRPLGTEEDEGPTQLLIRSRDGDTHYSMVLDDPREAQTFLATTNLARSKPTTRTPFVAFDAGSIQDSEIVPVHHHDDNAVSHIHAFHDCLGRIGN